MTKNSSEPVGVDPATDVMWWPLVKAGVGVAAVVVGWPVLLGWGLAPWLACRAWVWRRRGWWSRVVAACALGVLLVVASVVLAPSWWRLGSWTVPTALATAWTVCAGVGVVTVWARVRWAVSTSVDDDHGRPVWLDRVRRARRVAAVADARWFLHVFRRALSDDVLGVVARETASPRAGRKGFGQEPSTWVATHGRHKVLRWPGGAGEATRAVMLGASGAGKSTALTMIAIAALARGERVIMVNGKGSRQDTAAVVAAARQMGIREDQIRLWPEQPYDLWRGGPAEITDKVLCAHPPVDGAASYYRDEERTDLRLVCDVDTPPRSSDELLDRLRDPKPRLSSEADWQRMRRPVHRGGPARHLVTADRVHTALLGVAPLIDGSWAFDDNDIRLVIFTVRTPDDMRAAALILNDLEHYRRNRRRPNDPPLLVILDEAQVLMEHELAPPYLTQATEQYRSENISLIFATQSIHGLGADADRILGSGATLLLGRGLDVDDLVHLAGSHTRASASHTADGDDAPTASRQTFNIDPNHLRTAGRGEWVLLEPGREPIWAIFRTLPPPVLASIVSERVGKARRLVDSPTAGGPHQR